MTKKRKAKFRVGQVVCMPKGVLQMEDRYARLVQYLPDCSSWKTTGGLWYADHLRPLTARERGERRKGAHKG